MSGDIDDSPEEVDAAAVAVLTRVESPHPRQRVDAKIQLKTRAALLIVTSLPPLPQAFNDVK
jgi:hypothetical protein